MLKCNSHFSELRDETSSKYGNGRWGCSRVCRRSLGLDEVIRVKLPWPSMCLHICVHTDTHTCIYCSYDALHHLRTLPQKAICGHFNFELQSFFSLSFIWCISLCYRQQQQQQQQHTVTRVKLLTFFVPWFHYLQNVGIVLKQHKSKHSPSLRPP